MVRVVALDGSGGQGLLWGCVGLGCAGFVHRRRHGGAVLALGFLLVEPGALGRTAHAATIYPVAGRHAIPLPRDLHATVDQHRTAIVTRRVTPTAALHLPPLPQGFGSLARPPVFLNGGLRSVSPTPHQWKSILWAGHRTDAKVPFLAAAFIEGRR